MGKKTAKKVAITLIILILLIGISIPAYLLIDFYHIFEPKLEDYIANITDATALGIGKDDAISHSVSSKDGVSNSVKGKNDNNYFMKQVNDHLTQVKFYHKDNKNKVLTQDNMNFEIDKMYVWGDYTFVKFVRKGKGLGRPNAEDLEYGSDGIATYDKQNYGTNSYVIDNNTGYIYLLDGICIHEIQNGCLITYETKVNPNGSSYGYYIVYGYRINANDELEIFSIWNNPYVGYTSCIQDKYGHRFIGNTIINSYDAETDTYYGGVYHATSNHEAVRVSGYGENTIVEVVTADGTTRPVNSGDTFEVYSEYDNIIRVIDGVVYRETDTSSSSYFYSFSSLELGLFDSTTLDSYYLRAGGLYNGRFMREYDVLLMYDYYNSSIWYFTDIYATLTELIKTDITVEDGWHIDNIADINPAFVPHLLLQDCQITLDNKHIEKVGLSGSVYYDIVVEKVDGEVSVRALVSGTYEKSQLTIVLQPINR